MAVEGGHGVGGALAHTELPGGSTAMCVGDGTQYNRCSIHTHVHNTMTPRTCGHSSYLVIPSSNQGRKFISTGMAIL